MHVLLVNRFFGGAQVPTGRMLAEVAETLIRRGHQVTVLTSDARYAGSGGGTDPTPSVRTIRVWSGGSSSQVLGWCLFLVQAVFLLPFLAWDRCLILTDPPFSILAGLVSRVLRPSREVYWWTMDLYPEALVAAGYLRKGAWAYRLTQWLNEIALGRVNGVVCLGFRQLRRLQEYRNGSQGRCVSAVIPPWDGRELSVVTGRPNRVRDRFGWHGKKIVLYAGNLGPAHRYTELLDAARLMTSTGLEEWLFVFVVRGARREALELESQGMSNVVVMDYLPDDLTGDLLACADIHAITMESGWEGIVVPSKLYGLLWTRAPVLFVGPEDADTNEEIRKLSVGAAVGVSCPPTEVVRTLLELEQAVRPAIQRRPGLEAARLCDFFLLGSCNTRDEVVPQEGAAKRREGATPVAHHHRER